MSALLTLDRLSAAAPDGRALFHALTLSVGAQERVGLVGRNGSGKSTLLAVIAGDLAPAAGQVTRTGRIGVLAQDWSRALSGAERSRVGLARLLIEAPELILLDEPTNNLDADGRAAVAQLLARWRGHR